MKKKFLVLAMLFAFLSGSALSQDHSDIEKLQRLQLSENQVQRLFSMFFAEVPAIISEEVDADAVIDELGPRALRVLNRDQRNALRELDPEGKMHRFSSMTQDERAHFILSSARTLVHPSRKEWIDRIDEMIR